MPERKSHVKSRLGCVQCKARRVKCDEIRPTCGTCRRRQEACSYTTGKTTTSPSPGLLTGFDLSNSVPATVHLRQLELMHQWSTSTCFTLAMRSTGSDRHQIEVPRLALIHDCLLDTVFSFTSLHLAYLRPDQARTYIEDAVHYQARALTSTRQKLENLTPTLCEALYHASGHLGAIALAFRTVDSAPSGPTKPSEALLQLAQLWRGTALILEASRDLVDPETLKMFFPNVDFSTQPHLHPGSEIQTFLDRLRDRAQAGDTGVATQDGEGGDPLEQTRQIYLEAFGHLQETFHAGDYEHSRVFAWIVLTPPGFMEFLCQGQPLACTMTLLYTVLMEEFDTTWWTKDLRSQMLEELIPVVSAWDAEMAEISEYVQNWTKSRERLNSSATPLDSSIAEITDWVESSSLQDPRLTEEMGSTRSN